MTKRVLLTSVILFWAARAATAQTTTQFPIQFDFLNPGARSLAMGSAFSGLADDATAAFTNPAGLLALTRPEFSIEGRFRGVDTRFLSSGRISGTVLNVGEDRVSGPVYAEDDDGNLGMSFLSFTYPKGRWAFAGYRHELTRVENSFLYRGVFERATFAGITDDRNRDIPLTGDRSIKIDNYGGSVAFRVHPKLTLGAGLIVQKFELDAAFRRIGLTDLFGAPDPGVTGSTATQEGDDVAAAFTIGAQAQLTSTFRVGAVYRRGPDFEFTQTDVIPFRPTITQTGRFQVPDTIGVGIAWRPSESVTIASDYVRVNHSALKQDFINFQAVTSGLADRLEVDDANEFHLGVEYAFTQVKFVPAVRGGFWYDPAHAVTYNSNGSGDQLDTRFRFILPGGEDLWHYTFGVGLPFTQRFEFNVAADVTTRSRYASASAIVRF